MIKSERAHILERYPALAHVPPDLLRRLEYEAKTVQAPAGRRLFGEGSPCTHYPLLVEGIIRTTKSSPDGHEMLLNRLHPGESCIITVVALLGQTSYAAVGSTESEVLLYGLPRPLFEEILLRSPAFRVFVFQYLSARMADLMALIDAVAFRRVNQRLASRLLQQQEPLAVTHQMLADDLGTTREVVSRTLEAFQESGYLKLGRKRIEILDRPALVRVQ